MTTSNPVTVREAESAFIESLYGHVKSTPALRSIEVCARAWVAAARAEAIEEAAKVPDEWANGPSCAPNGCTHKVMGYEVAKRIRALARKGVEP